MKDLTKGYPAKVIIMFAIPIMGGYIFQMLYNLFDSMIVSNFINENALAAVGATAVVSNTLIGFTNGSAQGFAIPIARCFGAEDYKGMRKYVAGTVILSAIIAVILTVSSLFFIEPLLVLLNTPENLIGTSLDYVRIILAGICFSALYNMCANILRAVGDSKTPLIFLSIAVVLNIALDYIFVKNLDLGIKGAAYATIISQCISGVLTLIRILTGFKELVPEKDDWNVSSEIISELLPSGMAMAFMGCIVNIGTVILQSGINSLGNTIIAAHTAARKIFDMLTVALFTVGLAMTTYVSQNVGAGRYDRVRQGVLHANIITTIETIVMITLCFLFAKPLIIWLTGTSNTELINSAVMYMRISVVNYFWLGPLFVLRCTMQGLGRKIVPLLSSSIELGCKILSVLVLTPLLGYLGIAITEPISWCLCTIMLTIIYFVNKPGKGIVEGLKDINDK